MPHLKKLPKTMRKLPSAKSDKIFKRKRHTSIPDNPFVPMENMMDNFGAPKGKGFGSPKKGKGINFMGFGKKGKGKSRASGFGGDLISEFGSFNKKETHDLSEMTKKTKKFRNELADTSVNEFGF